MGRAGFIFIVSKRHAWKVLHVANVTSERKEPGRRRRTCRKRKREGKSRKRRRKTRREREEVKGGGMKEDKRVE